MNSKAKYIIGRLKQGLRTPQAIMFNEDVTHREVSFLFETVISAGFFHIENERVKVYGESTSLGVKSDPDKDEAIIGRALCFEAYRLPFDI